MNIFKTSLLGAALLVAGSLTHGVQAITIVTDFQIFESFDSSCPGLGNSTDCGHFTVINKRSDFVITSFAVGNPDVINASSLRLDWGASVDRSNAFGFGEDAFVYTGTGNFIHDTDGPVASFLFNSNIAASPVEVSFTDANGNAGSCTGVTGERGIGGCLATTNVAEPAPLLSLAFGLVGLAYMRRRRDAA
jgi:hypothetical protein